MGRFEEAVNAFRAAISLDPDYLPGYQSLGDLKYLLAEIETEKSQFERALDYYQEALEVFSTATEIRPDFEQGIRAKQEILDRLRKNDVGYVRDLRFKMESPADLERDR